MAKVEVEAERPSLYPDGAALQVPTLAGVVYLTTEPGPTAQGLSGIARLQIPKYCLHMSQYDGPSVLSHG